MQKILSDKTRKLLGLKPVLSNWKTLKNENIIYFYENNILHKVIFAGEEEGDSLIKEWDLTISLDETQQIITKRGKSVSLTIRNIEKEKSKETRLTINLTKNTVLSECGVKWLPELSFSNLSTIDEDISSTIEKLYGEIIWQKKVADFLKNPKTRQNYKDGDIFSIRLGSKKYVYALLIGSFMKLRKKDYWPSRETGHFLCHLMTVPIILRTFNFISERNDLMPEEIIKYELLNPEIISDDLLLRGSFKIVGHKQLTEEDVLIPMHYSFYGKHGQGGQSTAVGMGFRENKNNVRALIKKCIPYYKCIYLVFNWGIGAVEMDASLFLQNKNSDDSFIGYHGIGRRISGIDKNGKLINPHTIFSEEKLQSIFQTMNIDCEFTFDAFNKKYGGITRKEYLESIQDKK